MATRDYTTILLEELRGQMAAVLEYVGEVPIIKKRLDNIEQDVSELKSDMKVVKVAAVDLSQTSNDYEKRITRLEAVQNRS